MDTARVQARGQVTIPRTIREACGISPGTQLLFIRIGPDRFACRALPQRRSLVEFTAKHASYEDHPDFETIIEGFGEDALISPGAQHEQAVR